jgi:hypothetical protein
LDSDTQPANDEKYRATISSGFALFVVLAASLIGVSGGFMIANNVDLVGQLTYLANEFMKQISTVDAPTTTPPVKPDESPNPVQAAKGNLPPSPGSQWIGDVSCTQGQNSASVSIEVGGATIVRADRLKEPDRIYFDLQVNERPEGSKEGLLKTKTIPVSGPLVTGIRMSIRESGAARVVLDLTRACEYSYHLSSDRPSRLMVDVRPAGLGAAASKE